MLRCYDATLYTNEALSYCSHTPAVLLISEEEEAVLRKVLKIFIIVIDNIIIIKLANIKIVFFKSFNGAQLSRYRIRRIFMYITAD